MQLRKCPSLSYFPEKITVYFIILKTTKAVDKGYCVLFFVYLIGSEWLD
jgi:hypothetical protein